MANLSFMQVLGNIAPSWLAQRGVNQFFSPKRRTFTPEERDFLASSRPASVISSMGEFISYYQWGAGEKTILLVHGWEENAASLRWYVQPLTEMGYRVVALDAPKHGNSSGDETHFYNYSQAILAVVQALGGVYGIIAHSFGAPATSVFVESHPEIAVSKIVFIGAPNALTDVLTRTAHQMGLPLKVRDGMYRVIEQRFGRPIGDYSVARIFAERDLPLLIIHDRQDKVIPFSDGKQAAESASNGFLFATEGLGHRRILKDATVIAKVREFFAPHH